MKTVRVFFPLLLRKDGRPRAKQPIVRCVLNGWTIYIPRGRIAEVAEWVPAICAHAQSDEYECFVSVRPPVEVKP